MPMVIKFASKGINRWWSDSLFR